jgi:hypothetical protein
VLVPGTYQHYVATLTNPLFVVNFFLSILAAAFVANWLYYKNWRSITGAVLAHSMLNGAAVLIITLEADVWFSSFTHSTLVEEQVVAANVGREEAVALIGLPCHFSACHGGHHWRAPSSGNQTTPTTTAKPKPDAAAVAPTGAFYAPAGSVRRRWRNGRTVAGFAAVRPITALRRPALASAARRCLDCETVVFASVKLSDDERFKE